MAEILEGLLVLSVVLVSFYYSYKAKHTKGLLNKKQTKMINRILKASIILLVLTFIDKETFNYFDKYTFVGLGRILRLACYLLDYYIIGHDILKKAFKGIKNKQVFDENFLMAIATVGAFAIAIYENGEYLEAIAVMLFYQVGEWFQSYAVGKSRKNIGALMDIRPDSANLIKDKDILCVSPEEVEIGDIIVVNPGERVPLDGVIIEGKSTLNTSALTGESKPRDVSVDDEIYSGSINLTGVIKIKTSKVYGESTVAKILDLVENASNRKSKSEDFISKFARYYTPFVVYSALALALIPSIYLLITTGDGEFKVWIYRALTFLVISCPCALVISIPLTFFAGIGGASKEGVLIKGSNFLETLAKTKYVVFDKTGTLTKGVFEVAGIHHNTLEDHKVLEYAAYAECASSHPIAKSIKKAYGKEIDHTKISDIEEISGKGIKAKVFNDDVLIGNDKLMEEYHIAYKECRSVGTVIHLAINNEYAGHILISDIVRPNSKKAIKELKQNGVLKTTMLTGDIKSVAVKVKEELGLDEVYSELLPNDKVAKVEEMIANKNEKAKLAFVGDGINDAPVLTRADIGIAMGAMGSDAAIEAADVVLMDDDPLKISKAIKISRKCLNIVYQNIIFALVIKFGCLYLGAIGSANMWFAIFADVGVMVIAVLNAIRAINVSKL